MRRWLTQMMVKLRSHTGPSEVVWARGTASLRALSWVFAWLWHVVQQEDQCVEAERTQGLSGAGWRLDGVRPQQERSL